MLEKGIIIKPVCIVIPILITPPNGYCIQGIKYMVLNQTETTLRDTIY